MFGMIFMEFMTGDGDVEFEVGHFRKPDELKKEKYFDFLRLFGVEPEEEKANGDNHERGIPLSKGEIFQILLENGFLIESGFLAKIRSQWRFKKYFKQTYSLLILNGYDFRPYELSLSNYYAFTQLVNDKTGVVKYALTLVS